MCLYECGFVYMSTVLSEAKRLSNSLEMELLAVVDFLMSMQGNKLKSPRSAYS